MVEQLIRNQQIVGSSPIFSSTYGITFVYQAKVILFLSSNRIATRFTDIFRFSEIFS